MLGNRTALGVDISNGEVNLALLGKGRKGIRLLKAARGPIPDGVVENGVIKDAAALAKCIKRLKAKARIHCGRMAVSFVASPMVMQVLDVPKEAIGNMRRFVQEQVKHYAALPIKKSLMDYCGIKSVGKRGRRRAFVVATDGRKIVKTAKALHRSGLRVSLVEPPVVSYIRACYQKRITAEFDRTLLYVTVHDGSVVFCAFRQGSLDFVRTRQVRSDALESREFRDWLAREAVAIMRFYELDDSAGAKAWAVTVLIAVEEGPAQKILECLKAKLDGAEVRVVSHREAYIDTVVSEQKHKTEPSAVAIGLAMGLLDGHDSGLNVNLLPDEVRRAGSTERRILVSANAAALVLLVIILSVVLLTKRAASVNASVCSGQEMNAGRDVHLLGDEQKSLEAQIAELSTKTSDLDSVLDSGGSVRWAAVLGDIGSAIPKTVRITSLSYMGGSGVSIEGVAVSYEPVQLFVEMLGNCEHIESASLLENRTDNKQGGLIRYSITCSLARRFQADDDR